MSIQSSVIYKIYGIPTISCGFIWPIKNSFNSETNPESIRELNTLYTISENSTVQSHPIRRHLTNLASATSWICRFLVFFPVLLTISTSILHTLRELNSLLLSFPFLAIYTWNDVSILNDKWIIKGRDPNTWRETGGARNLLCALRILIPGKLGRREILFPAEGEENRAGDGHGRRQDHPRWAENRRHSWTVGQILTKKMGKEETHKNPL